MKKKGILHRNSTYIILGMIGLIPMFLTNLMNMVVTMIWHFGNPDQKTQFFLGQLNNPVVFWISVVGIFGMAFVFSAMMVANRHASKMDNLDLAAETYAQMTKEMEAARDGYTEQLKKLKSNG